MATGEIEIIRNDDRTLNVTVKNSDGTVFNLTGYKVYFTVKKRVTDADADAVISKDVVTHSDPTNGKTTVDLLKTETNVPEGSYYYDFQMKNISTGKVASSRRGLFRVIEDITKRTT